MEALNQRPKSLNEQEQDDMPELPFSKPMEDDAPSTPSMEDLTSLHTQFMFFTPGSSPGLSTSMVWKLQKAELTDLRILCSAVSPRTSI